MLLTPPRPHTCAAATALFSSSMFIKRLPSSFFSHSPNICKHFWMVVKLLKQPSQLQFFFQKISKTEISFPWCLEKHNFFYFCRISRIDFCFLGFWIIHTFHCLGSHAGVISWPTLTNSCRSQHEFVIALQAATLIAYPRGLSTPKSLKVKKT